MVFDLAMNQPVTDRTIRNFGTNQGAQIYQFPLEAFPGFWVYAYLVLVEDYQVLVDVGSGFGKCNADLETCLRNVNDQLDIEIGLPYLTHVFITHGHIDHYGGLPFVRAGSPAKVGVHELDVHSLINTEERLTIFSRQLNDFLIEAGFPSQRRDELIQLYKLSKLDYVPVPVDFGFESIGMALGPFEMLHVPGHCAGQVVIRLHDVLFSGDHVLADISPHQSPERLVLNTGLGHYLYSLKILRNWGGDIHLTLGGHNEPITDLIGRLDEINSIHEQRLALVLKILNLPQTISEVSEKLFKAVHGYNELLALEETGAHVEYLYQRGKIGIKNLAELETEKRQVPILYQTSGYPDV